jgi:hypothetical protein
VHDTGNSAHERHAVDEGRLAELELSRGFAGREELAGGAPHQPAQRDQGRADQEIDHGLLHAQRKRRQMAVEGVEDDVLTAQRHQRQRREDHDHHQQLGQLERARDGVVQELAAADVEERQHHDGEEGGGGEQAARPFQEFLQRRLSKGPRKSASPLWMRPRWTRWRRVIFPAWRFPRGTRRAPCRRSSAPWPRPPSPTSARGARCGPSRRQRIWRRPS